MARFTETVLHELPPVEDGVLKGAKLLGLSSRNKRRYESKALESAKGLYEGRKVYVDHPNPEDAGKDRHWNDWAGIIENVRFKKDDGLYADIVLRQESSHFKGIVEAASNPKFRKNCGFSHVAEGESHLDGDTEIVESIKEVFSVDLVTDPASTGGLFESQKKTTIREAVESLPADQPLRKRLTEMMDAGYMDGGFALGGEKEDKPDDHVLQLIAIVRDMTVAFADSLKALADANATANKPSPAPVVPAVPADEPAGDPFPADDPFAATEDEDMLTPEQKAAKAEDEKKKQAAFESLQRENAELKAKGLLLETNREASKARIAALAKCADAKEQKELLESWPVAEDGRPLRSPALTESTDYELRKADSLEQYAAMLR